MPKSEDQLLKDVQATIKVVLSELEALGALPADQAGPGTVRYDESRRIVVRALWRLHKETKKALQSKPCAVCGALPEE